LSNVVAFARNIFVKKNEDMEESKFATFKSLHAASKLLILPNAWDAESALILQECKYPAVGTSSSAVAASLGYQDGEGMPFADYLVIIRRIAASVAIPVTIDFEMGYGKTKEQVYANVQHLLDVGVVGINLEDSVIANGTRTLKDATEFAQTLGFIKNKLDAGRQSLFINVRSDTYLLKVKDVENETSARLKIYESAGADGIFLPFISAGQDIARVKAETRLPLNVMCLPGLPEIDALQKLGVNRVSMGPFLHNKVYNNARELAKKVIEQNSLTAIL